METVFAIIVGILAVAAFATLVYLWARIALFLSKNFFKGDEAAETIIFYLAPLAPLTFYLIGKIILHFLKVF